MSPSTGGRGHAGRGVMWQTVSGAPVGSRPGSGTCSDILTSSLCNEPPTAAQLSEEGHTRRIGDAGKYEKTSNRSGWLPVRSILCPQWHQNNVIHININPEP